MILLRRVLGDALRARRQAQHRTLREVSGAANVSLGYLSEIERGQKEASSELLSAICAALGAKLYEVLRDVSDTLEFAELTDAGVLSPEHRRLAPAGVGATGAAGAGGPAESVGGVEEPVAEPAAALEFATPTPREPGAVAGGTVTNFIGDGRVAVAVRHEGPLRTTLLTTRNGGPRREVVRAA